MKTSLFLLWTIPSLLLAQVSNPYFPVHEDDYWEYFYQDQTRMDIAQVEMTIDFTDSLENIYFYRFGHLFYSGDSYLGGYYKVDSVGNIYYLSNAYQEWLVLPHNASELDWWIVYADSTAGWIYEVAKVESVYTDTLFSRPIQCIDVVYQGGGPMDTIPPIDPPLGGAPHNGLRFATEFGIVAGSEAFGGELGPGIELRGARIDSVEYGTLVGIAEEMPPVPDRIQLFPNFPNPFNNHTTIPFVLPTSALVRVTIYNMRGRKVTTLMPPTHLSAGRHTLTWDGTTQKGGMSSSGLYFYVITVGNRNVSRSMLFVK